MKIITQAQTNAQRLAVLVPACLLGAYVLGLCQPYIPQDKSIIPVGVIAVLASPIPIAMGVLSKLADVRKLKSFSRQEKRRLEPKIDRKVSAIHKLVMLYSLLSIAVGASLFFASIEAGEEYSLWIYRFAGASFTFAIVSSWMLLAESKRTTDFEAYVINRSNERKQKAALLKRLQPKGD
ncbi:hypothetical protein [Pseudomonas monteilii]|uniref:hypothetical protein n=1 Tax=Pseudomonas monteilii TaxID=76759 RepID=UPI001CBACFD1|nr:hypothetical protein [Pseudomonas monteilii]MBZ3665545.1 hypothetical protein [Pseudomonas monteilii]MBZ3670889.1 hypothetical protein [Pseudomonas monteilii]